MGAGPGRTRAVVLVDEYAELPDEAKQTIESLSRTGRAVVVNVLAATQRPTQDAMGRGATRAQMAVRICLQVKEKRDTDLILDQGSWSGRLARRTSSTRPASCSCPTPNTRSLVSDAAT